MSEELSICQKCGELLTPGRGDFYVVNVESYAEASSPVITVADLAKDHAAEMQRIVEELKEISPQEAMDGVHRQLTFFLCRPCYKVWIENPTG